MASVNWPWSPTEVVYPNTETNDLQISPAFERYVEDINNWSLTPAALNRFQTLLDKAWLKPSYDVLNGSDQLEEATTASSSSFVL